MPIKQSGMQFGHFGLHSGSANRRRTKSAILRHLENVRQENCLFNLCSARLFQTRASPPDGFVIDTP
jgi:hypothetical protein